MEENTVKDPSMAASHEPLVSVIVPVYNIAAYLPTCIDSILAQTYERFELLLIDDGSTDESGSICDRYAAKDSRVRVVHQINSGISVVRNTGLDLAQGEFISFVDGDDSLVPDAYETCLRAYQAHPDVHLVRFSATPFCEDKSVDTGRSVWGSSADLLLKGEDSLRFMVLSKDYHAAVWCSFYPKAFIGSARFKKGIHLGEDQLFSLLCMTRNSPLWTDAPTVLILGRPLYNYRVLRPGALTTTKDPVVQLDRYEVYMEMIEELRRQHTKNLAYTCAYVLRELYQECGQIWLPHYPFPGATAADKHERKRRLAHFCRRMQAYPLPAGWAFGKFRRLRSAPMAWMAFKQFRKDFKRKLLFWKHGSR